MIKNHETLICNDRNVFFVVSPHRKTDGPSKFYALGVSSKKTAVKKISFPIAVRSNVCTDKVSYREALLLKRNQESVCDIIHKKNIHCLISS